MYGKLATNIRTNNLKSTKYKTIRQNYRLPVYKCDSENCNHGEKNTTVIYMR